MQRVYLILDLMTGGDLDSLLSRRGRLLPEEDAAFYAAEIVLGLRYLHENGIVHRDIKVGGATRLSSRCSWLLRAARASLLAVH
jgi:serine/threonine protein kinase